ncbi:hypothetical protein XJ44_03715 [Thermosipho affectus]|uniref:GGDEF domain-containing protein n=1 Tax=Thermosipho affectus TaxID=660294 RepID=A0ABX3IJR6_9BACT|nr:sensor domain-containing diguanylate cyclase [Thermosipho affectus]ONN27431.1 hypothetical protein XJ44_03715 [Thermosipho affectus]
MVYIVIVSLFFVFLIFKDYFYVCFKLSCFNLNLKLQIKNRFISVLYEILLKNLRNEKENLYNVFEYIKKLLGADSWSFLFTPENKEWRFLLWSSTLDEKPLEILGEYFQKQSPNNLKKIMLSKEYFYIEDVIGKSYWVEVKEISVKSWVGIPLVYNGKVYGILNIDWYKLRRKKSTDDIIFKSITENLSFILYNYLKLHEKVNDVNRDILTNLYSRKVLDDVLIENYTHILFIDLNKFKNINDTYGHLMGDEVLRIISERMKRTIKNGDLLIRYGGDEFVLLINSSEEGVKVLVKRLKEHISKRINIGNKDICIGVSIGIQKVVSGKSLDELIKLADEKMYEDKNKKLN